MTTRSERRWKAPWHAVLCQVGRAGTMCPSIGSLVVPSGGMNSASSGPATFRPSRQQQQTPPPRPHGRSASRRDFIDVSRSCVGSTLRAIYLCFRHPDGPAAPVVRGRLGLWTRHRESDRFSALSAAVPSRMEWHELLTCGRTPSQQIDRPS